MPGGGRLWTLEEANAALSTVEARLRAARQGLHRLREAKTAMDRLLAVWGPALHDPAHDAHAEFRRRTDDFEVASGQVHGALSGLTDLGIEVKDVESGLVDFPSRLGDEVVYLCWRVGEPEVGHWHRVEAGFAGRRPVPRVVLD